jgi:hypothetical protein
VIECHSLTEEHQQQGAWGTCNLSPGPCHGASRLGQIGHRMVHSVSNFPCAACLCFLEAQRITVYTAQTLHDVSHAPTHQIHTILCLTHTHRKTSPGQLTSKSWTRQRKSGTAGAGVPSTFLRAAIANKELYLLVECVSEAYPGTSTQAVSPAFKNARCCILLNQQLPPKSIDMN